MKCLHGWSNESFTSLLELLKEAMPELNIPPSYNKTKSMVKNLGLDYEKIDACKNDCMLFRNNHMNYEFCRKCRASLYIKNLDATYQNRSMLDHQWDALTFNLWNAPHHATSKNLPSLST